ncbi:MAG: hypothetical protein DMG06_03935 [Acidobacteria bacterium]|nr:MAG: hypothetical protein DMG06_03935 [Acidobacteriota bacterium]
MGDTTVEVNSTTQLIIVKRIFGRGNAKLRLRNASLAPREFSQSSRAAAEGGQRPPRAGWPNVILVTWKLAEDRRGSIFRFLEIGGKATAIRVTTPLLKIEAAWLCNAVFGSRRPVSVAHQNFSFSIRPLKSPHGSPAPVRQGDR